jgi:DNA-binding transcriptional ArsR family regulator
MPGHLSQFSRAEIERGAVFFGTGRSAASKGFAILATPPDAVERTCASFGFPVAKPSLTHHFKTLRGAGLISQTDHETSGPRLRKADIKARFPELPALLVGELTMAAAASRPAER